MNTSHSSSTATSQTGAVPIYATVLSVGAICALAIVMVSEITRPIIRQNQVELTQRAIRHVLPDATTSRAFRWEELTGQIAPVTADVEDGQRLYAGYDDRGRLVGLAIEASGMGYQDTIRLLYGYSFAEQAVISIRVLESRETPGLGDRIETDADFLRNFERLPVPLNTSGTDLAHPITFVKAGDKTEPWQIDGITGATISSRAVADILSRSTSLWIPRVHRQRDRFNSASEEST